MVETSSWRTIFHIVLVDVECLVPVEVEILHVLLANFFEYFMNVEIHDTLSVA